MSSAAALASPAQPVVLACGCGRSYTLREYLALPVPATVRHPAGATQYLESGDHGEPESVLLWRDCPCHSSHAIELRPVYLGGVL